MIGVIIYCRESNTGWQAGGGNINIIRGICFFCGHGNGKSTGIRANTKISTINYSSCCGTGISSPWGTRSTGKYKEGHFTLAGANHCTTSVFFNIIYHQRSLKDIWVKCNLPGFRIK